MKKAGIFLLICLLVMGISQTGISAAETAVYIEGRPVGKELSGVILDGSSYVPLRAVYEFLGGKLTWDGATATARYKTNGLEITATAGDIYFMANGRAVYCPKGLFVDRGRFMLPCRQLAKALGGDAVWENSTRSVYLTTGPFIQSGRSYYDEDELYWLSRIISSESRGEPLSGQIAVGNVVLNRVAHKNYPSSIYGVIFDRNYGVQFEPVLNGTIYDDPAEISVIAAKLCLEGVDLSRGSIYFYNPTIAQSNWIGQNCDYVMTIGTHLFYS